MSALEAVGFVIAVFGGVLFLAFAFLGVFWVLRLARLGYEIEKLHLGKLDLATFTALLKAKAA